MLHIYEHCSSTDTLFRWSARVERNISGSNDSFDVQLVIIFSNLCGVHMLC